MENEDQNWLSDGRALVSRCHGDGRSSPAQYSKGWFVYFLFFPASAFLFGFHFRRCLQRGLGPPFSRINGGFFNWDWTAWGGRLLFEGMSEGDGELG